MEYGGTNSFQGAARADPSLASLWRPGSIQASVLQCGLGFKVLGSGVKSSERQITTPHHVTLVSRLEA